MPPVSYANFDFNRMRQEQRWSPIEQFNGDLAGFAAFVGQPHPSAGTSPGITPYAMAAMKASYPEVEAAAGAGGLRPGQFMIQVHAAANRTFVSLARSSQPVTLVWTCWSSAEVEPAACFRRMAVIARGKRTGVEVLYPGAEDQAFMWKASSVHPLQVRENAYQRIVHHAGQEPDADRVKEQSETLARYFIADAGPPASFAFTPADLEVRADYAAVRMNHLIEGFYLFRLLVPYRIRSEQPITDDLRAELSGELTRLLHNGDAGRMGWLSAWLTAKIAELARSIQALNKPGEQRRVVFFLKGGRALNFYLGTPEKGENDWDTQVVIDPRLPAQDWYRCYSEVHDVLLAALRKFKAEFTALVESNASSFAEYLCGRTAPDVADDEASAGNEASDIRSKGDSATCKAELIDVGIPRRDSASALEEWTRLSAPGALLEAAGGVVYPHRTYYLNEYLMMIREAFLPHADAKKVPKRLTRFGLILAGKGPSMVDPKRLAVLPRTADRIATLQPAARSELFGIMFSEFAEAYNLVQDRGLAALFDTEAAAMIATPPALLPALAQVLDGAQASMATDIGVAHALSERMAAHWAARTGFFRARQEFFDGFLRELARATNRALRELGAQFAVAGSYAARLHAGHLRMAPDGLEPIRRILVKLQCPRGTSEAQVMAAVADAVAKAAADSGQLALADVADPKKRSLVLVWREATQIDPFRYAPLVMKIRGAAQAGSQLPVLASIDGIPVLDLRYLAADYLKKTSKIDEQGSRRVLAAAAAAVSEMLSRFDFDSDEDD